MTRYISSALVIAIIQALVMPADAETFTYVSLNGENRIAVYALDAARGSLEKRADIKIESPAGALCVSPDRRFLYASLRPAGKLASFRIEQDSGSLSHINTVPAGADPAFVATDKTGAFLMTAYYVAAQVTVHKLAAGRISDVPVQTLPTAEKAHAILTDRENRFAFVPHTGPNAIYQFHFDPASGRLTPSDQPIVPTGENTGPRQLAFHPQLDVVYFDYEQGSAIAAFDLDRRTGRLTFRERLSTLPAGFAGPNSNARIEISPTGKFIFVANRGHDSLAGFAVDQETGRLIAIGQTATEPTPRGFAIDPSGRSLVAAGQSSDKLAVFRIHPATGELTRSATCGVGKQPWWVLITRAAD